MAIKTKELSPEDAYKIIDTLPTEESKKKFAKLHGIDLSKDVTPETSSNLSQDKSFLAKDWSNKTLGGKIFSAPAEFLSGVMKSSLKTPSVLGEAAGNVIGKGMEALTGTSLSKIGSETPKVSEQLSSTNIPGKIGAGIETVAEFLLPSAATAKVSKNVYNLTESSNLGKLAIKTLGPTVGNLLSKLFPKTAQVATTALGESLSTGALMAGKGEDSDDIKVGMLLGGGIPIVGSVFSAAAAPVSKKIISSLIKPSEKVIKQGFNIENIYKYGLTGNLNKMGKQTFEKIGVLVKQLDDLIKSGSEAGAKIDYNKLFQKSEDEILEGMSKGKFVGQEDRIINALENIKKSSSYISDDLASGQQFKRGVGKLGAWVSGSRDPDASAMEVAADIFYSNLKKEIEDVSPEGVRQINKQLSELIPIENALITAMSRADKANTISLIDALTLIPSFQNPANIWMFILNKSLRSGVIAKGLGKIGGLQESGTPVGSALLNVVIGGKTPVK